MKRLWTIISILALANVLALGGVVGWLQTSGRLNKDRMQRLRELFAPTIAEEAKAKEAEAAKLAEEKKKAEEETKSARPPITAADRLDLSAKGEEVRRQRMASLEKQVESLKNSLQMERELLDKERAKLTADTTAFNAMRKKIADDEGSAQFKKTLGTLSDLKPDQAKKTLKEMLAMKPASTGDGQSFASGTDLVVSYLNAMDGRTRGKIVDQFIQDDPKLAADLLERLRTRGLAVRAPEVSAK
ncbi:MAG: hypothetical protein K2Y21_13950 [Phycisphaerales bacterium]|nr:hypothetical protein [Phycisphaerales bacterium]